MRVSSGLLALGYYSTLSICVGGSEGLDFSSISLQPDHYQQYLPPHSDENWFGRPEELKRLSDNGLTRKVQWDNSTLYIDGQKIFIYSGEFHYWRIPVPSLYLDIFQKLRATGYNAVSIYFHWGFHNPAEGVWDFETGAHDIQPIFEAAKKAGLWVIARPGPYIHAETTAGGLPGWLVQLPNIEVRTNGTKYTKYWKQYIERIGPIIARNQIGGAGTGTVILAQIENEFYWGGGFKYDGANEYMTMISQAYRDAGIVVPIFHNDVGMARAWLPKNYPGVLDIYGLDGYPRGFDCNYPLEHFYIRTDYYNYFKKWYPDGPQFTPEFQGGAFDPWGGPGYEKCAEMVGTSFVNVYYKNNIAQRFTMMNFYMAFGGTNWGYLLTPVVYTSYDYGAGISEARLLRDKINSEGKLIALFLHTMDSILHANLVGNTTSPTADTQYSTNPAIYTTELHNPATNTRFYVLRHADTNSLEDQTFDLRLTTTEGVKYLKGMNLNKRESKILVTDYQMGDVQVLYATSEIVTWGRVDGIDTVFLVLDEGNGAEEIAWMNRKGRWENVGEYEISSEGAVRVEVRADGGIADLKLEVNQGVEMAAVNIRNAFNAVYMNKRSAYRFWAPVLREGPGKVDIHEQVFVHGPYLVRNATADGDTLRLAGDVNRSTTLLVWASREFTTVTWNGEKLHMGEGPYFSRRARIKGPDRGLVKLPVLNSTEETEWMVMDSLPEVRMEYDDSEWVVARNWSTNEAFPPLTLPCLLAGEYGFHTGTVIYRGRFNTNQPAGRVTGVHLEVWGGTAFGYVVYLNGHFLASQPGHKWRERFVNEWDFPERLLNKHGENILVVVSDSNGYDRDNGVTFFDGHTTKKPRGIKAARLRGPEGLDFTRWTLQGNAGGERYDDTVRAPYNEDGLYAVRIGAHFPSFNATPSLWSEGNPVTGFSGPGIKFYRTTVTINFPETYDVPLAFVLHMPKENKARIQLFVNGYQMGRYVGHIGPQEVFPVYPGIVRRGENVIGLAVWGMEEGAQYRLDRLYLTELEVLISGYGDMEGSREKLVPGWPEGRRKYVMDWRSGDSGVVKVEQEEQLTEEREFELL
ncbi:glycoside hydrolase superfamily [Kalaharituber pfeilii]|nr:glycoside hydrolase superfamily [Kalaharituber pfeilii]